MSGHVAFSLPKTTIALLKQGLLALEQSDLTTFGRARVSGMVGVLDDALSAAIGSIITVDSDSRTLEVSSAEVLREIDYPVNWSDFHPPAPCQWSYRCTVKDNPQGGEVRRFNNTWDWFRASIVDNPPPGIYDWGATARVGDRYAATREDKIFFVEVTA